MASYAETVRKTTEYSEYTSSSSSSSSSAPISSSSSTTVDDTPLLQSSSSVDDIPKPAVVNVWNLRILAAQRAARKDHVSPPLTVTQPIAAVPSPDRDDPFIVKMPYREDPFVVKMPDHLLRSQEQASHLRNPSSDKPKQQALAENLLHQHSSVVNPSDTATVQHRRNGSLPGEGEKAATTAAAKDNEHHLKSRLDPPRHHHRESTTSYAAAAKSRQSQPPPPQSRPLPPAEPLKLQAPEQPQTHPAPAFERPPPTGSPHTSPFDATAPVFYPQPHTHTHQNQGQDQGSEHAPVLYPNNHNYPYQHHGAGSGSDSTAMATTTTRVGPKSANITAPREKMVFGTITVNVDLGVSEGKETSKVSKERGVEGGETVNEEEKGENQKKSAIALAIGMDTLAREDGPVRVGTRGVQKKVGATTISPSVSFSSSAKGVGKAENLDQNEGGQDREQVKARGRDILVADPAPSEVKWKFGTADSPDPDLPTIVDAGAGKAGTVGEQGTDSIFHQHQLSAQHAHTLLPDPHHLASSSFPSPLSPSSSVSLLTTSISPLMPIPTPMSISPSPSTDLTVPASADPEFEVKDFGFGFGNARLRDEDEDEGAKETVVVQGEGTESNEIEGHDVDLDGQNVHNDSYAYPLLGENLLPHHHGYSYNYHYNHNHNHQYNYAQYPHAHGGGGGRGRRGFPNGRGAYISERERDRGYPHGHGGRRGRGVNGLSREYARGGEVYGVNLGHHNHHFGSGQPHHRGMMNTRGGAGSGSGTAAGGSDPSSVYTITPPPPFQPLPLSLASESSTSTSPSGTGTGTPTGGTIPSLPPPYYHQQLHHHHHQQHFHQPGLGLGVGIGQGLGQRRPYLPPGYEPYASPTIPGMPPPPPPHLLGGFGVGGGMHSLAYAHHGQGSLEPVESGEHCEQEQEQVRDQGQSGSSEHADTATGTALAPGTGKPHLLIPAPVPVPLSTIAFPLDATRYYLLGQLEYYLSPQNMAQDFYLRQQIDARGWIPISLLASFNRVRQLTHDVHFVRDVLTLSSLVEVRGNMVRMGGWETFVLPGAKPSSVEEQPLPVWYRNLTEGEYDYEVGSVGEGPEGRRHPHPHSYGSADATGTGIEYFGIQPQNYGAPDEGVSDMAPLSEHGHDTKQHGSASLMNGEGRDDDDDDDDEEDEEDEVEIVIGGESETGTFMGERRRS